MAPLTAQEKPLLRRCTRCEMADECCPERTPPSIDLIWEWQEEGGCETPSGEWVEPDGHTPEGCPSWMLILGLI